MSVAYDQKNGISRFDDFVLAAVCVYAGLYLDRVERGEFQTFTYIVLDPHGEAVKLEAELNEFSVEAKPFVNALKVVMGCQNKLRRIEREAQEENQ